MSNFVPTGQDTLISRATERCAKRITAVFCVMLVAVVLLSVCAFAAETAAATTIEEAINNAMDEVYTVVKTVITAIVAVVVVVQAIRLATGSERSIESARTRLMICAIAIAIVYLGPMIVKQVATWVTSDGTTPSTAGASTT